MRADQLYLAPRLTKTSRYSYAETIARLSAAVAAAGNRICATISQSGSCSLGRVDVASDDAHRLWKSEGRDSIDGCLPMVGLELPLKLLVSEPNAVNVAYSSMSEIAARYGVTGMDARIAAIDDALEALTSSVAVARRLHSSLVTLKKAFPTSWSAPL